MELFQEDALVPSSTVADEVPAFWLWIHSMYTIFRKLNHTTLGVSHPYVQVFRVVIITEIGVSILWLKKLTITMLQTQITWHS